MISYSVKKYYKHELMEKNYPKFKDLKKKYIFNLSDNKYFGQLEVYNFKKFDLFNEFERFDPKVKLYPGIYDYSNSGFYVTPGNLIPFDNWNNFNLYQLDVQILEHPILAAYNNTLPDYKKYKKPLIMAFKNVDRCLDIDISYIYGENYHNYEIDEICGQFVQKIQPHRMSNILVISSLTKESKNFYDLCEIEYLFKSIYKGFSAVKLLKSDEVNTTSQFANNNPILIILIQLICSSILNLDLNFYLQGEKNINYRKAFKLYTDLFRNIYCISEIIDKLYFLRLTT